MSSFYTRMAETANRLLKQFGGDVTIIERVNTGTKIDPVYTETKHVVKGVITRYAHEEVDGIAIQMDDLLYVVDCTFNPTPDMVIRFQDRERAIISVRDICPSGNQSVVYFLQVRQ